MARARAGKYEEDEDEDELAEEEDGGGDEEEEEEEEEEDRGAERASATALMEKVEEWKEGDSEGSQ